MDTDLPDHLTPITPAAEVHRICEGIDHLTLPYTVRLELVAFRETRTPHDAKRLATALRHVAKRPDVADEIDRLCEVKAGD